jgi:hypothetical protein
VAGDVILSSIVVHKTRAEAEAASSSTNGRLCILDGLHNNGDITIYAGATESKTRLIKVGSDQVPIRFTELEHAVFTILHEDAHYRGIEDEIEASSEAFIRSGKVFK